MCKDGLPQGCLNAMDVDPTAQTRHPEHAADLIQVAGAIQSQVFSSGGGRIKGVREQQRRLLFPGLFLPNLLISIECTCKGFGLALKNKAVLISGLDGPPPTLSHHQLELCSLSLLLSSLVSNSAGKGHFLKSHTDRVEKGVKSFCRHLRFTRAMNHFICVELASFADGAGFGFGAACCTRPSPCGPSDKHSNCY